MLNQGGDPGSLTTFAREWVPARFFGHFRDGHYGDCSTISHGDIDKQYFKGDAGRKMGKPMPPVFPTSPILNPICPQTCPGCHVNLHF